jgi:predicted transposase/invertase (TIGR01784 family)
MKKPLLNIKVDYVFKLIFGDQRNTDILAGFLKAALNLPEAEYDSLTIVDPHLKPEFEGDKAGVLDVKVHTKTGIGINVEIQVSVYSGLRSRFAEYAAKMLAEQIKRGEHWSQAKRVIGIFIVNDILIPEEKGYYNSYALLNRKTGTEFTDLIEINTLELPKLPEQSDGTVLWDWGHLFLSETEEELNMVAEKDPVIKKAVGTLMVLSEDERERLLAESREKFLYDQYHREKEAYEKGLAAGEAKGRIAEEKARLEKLEAARKLKARGFSDEEIAGILQIATGDIAGLSIQTAK